MLSAANPPALPALPALDEWLPGDHWETAAVFDRPADGIVVEWLQASWVQALLCIAVALPLVWLNVLPLTDLGGHLGRFAVQLDAGKSASLRDWYSIHWTVIPNLGTDLLMQWLAPHLGLEPALKMIVIAIVVTQAGGFLALARVVHGHVPPTALLALPLVYSYPFQYGFLNFTLATALGTWALALWIVLDRPAWRRARGPVFVPIACGLWICHLEGWALFCILAGACEFAHWHNEGLVTWRAVLARSARPLACLVVPGVLFALWPHAGGPPGETGVWFDVIGKLGMLVMSMRDRWGVWDAASALALIGVIGWTWNSRQFSRDAGLSLGAVLATAAFALLPKHVGGTSFVDMRLAPMMMAIALITVRPRAGGLDEDGRYENAVQYAGRKEPRLHDAAGRPVIEMLAIAALCFVGARLTGNATSMAIFDRQFEQDLAVLDSVPRDAPLVTLTVKPCFKNDPWLRERRTHLAGYALARRHAFANDQWAMAGGQLLRVHAPAMGQFIGDPSQTAAPVTCQGKPGVTELVDSMPSAVAYLWIVEDGVARVFTGWHPIRASSGSVLYTRDAVVE